MRKLVPLGRDKKCPNNTTALNPGKKQITGKNLIKVLFYGFKLPHLCYENLKSLILSLLWSLLSCYVSLIIRQASLLSWYINLLINFGYLSLLLVTFAYLLVPRFSMNVCYFVCT